MARENRITSTEPEVETEEKQPQRAYLAEYHGAKLLPEEITLLNRRVTIIARRFDLAHRKAKNNTKADERLVKLEELQDTII